MRCVGAESKDKSTMNWARLRFDSVPTTMCFWSKFKHFKRNFLLFSAALRLNWLNIDFILRWSSHVSRMCFHVETLDQTRAHFANLQPATRAVEKFPVSPFHLEMAASSTESSTQSSTQSTTHSDELESQESLLGEGDETPRFDVDGELGLDSQGLLAEKSETPRFCSVYLRGTAPKCLLGFIMFWVSGMSITIFVLKLNWHIILRCLPGCSFGFLLVLMASYEVKRRESKHTEKLPMWALMALPHFLWLILLSVFEIHLEDWQQNEPKEVRQCHTLEVAGTALGCLGLCGWMADEPEWYDRYNNFGRWRNGWRIAGWMLQISGLLVMWLGALPCLDGRGPAIHRWKRTHFHRTFSAVFHGTAAERHVATVYRPGTCSIFVPVHRCLQLDLVWCKRQEDPGRVRCCDLQVFFRCFAGLWFSRRCLAVFLRKTYFLVKMPPPENHKLWGFPLENPKPSSYFCRCFSGVLQVRDFLEGVWRYFKGKFVF